jgi:predicted deacylase
VRIVTPVSRAPWQYEIVGYSAGGHALEAFRFGSGPREILLIGGHHGGYEWNTILLAYAVADYFTAYPDEIPPGVTLTIIPVANPDGQLLVTGRRGRFNAADVALANTAVGRFNANGVDLNRNWECDWSPVGEWRGIAVSGGSAPLSEPENQALLAYVLANRPVLVIFWHSAVPGVFYGSCGGPPLPQTVTYGAAYAAAAGYDQSATFAAYSLTGDAANSLATLGIPSFAVELTNHTDLDLARNLRGVLAVIDRVP